MGASALERHVSQAKQHREYTASNKLRSIVASLTALLHGLVVTEDEHCIAPFNSQAKQHRECTASNKLKSIVAA